MLPSASAYTRKNSGSSSGFFEQSFRGTFTTPVERKFWSDYIPLEKLGEGSFGSVVAALRARDDLPVAVKTVSKTDVTFVEISEDVDEPEEVFSLRQLENVENAIRVIDWKETPDKVIIVLERPENYDDLKSFMRQKGGRLNEEDARKIILQLSTCVNKFMKRCVLHRDLKPSNILVNKDTLEIKVIDFGLTSEVHSSEDVFREAMGTQGYLPPESIEKRRYIAGPAMVWAIGVITYQLVTGVRPFLTNQEVLSLPVRVPRRLSSACNSFILGCLTHFKLRLPISSLSRHSWLSPEVDSSSSEEEQSDEDSSDVSYVQNPRRKRKAEDDIDDETPAAHTCSWSGRTQTPPPEEAEVASSSSSYADESIVSQSSSGSSSAIVTPSKVSINNNSSSCIILSSSSEEEDSSPPTGNEFKRQRTMLESLWKTNPHLSLADLEAAQALCLLWKNSRRNIR